MLKTILLCLTVLAIISRADPTFADCNNEVRSSLSLISQFDQDLTNKNLTQIRADFASLQTRADSINKACDHMLHIGGTVPSPEITNCDGIVEDLRSNVHKFVTNNQKYDFDTVQMLGYLTSKSLIFATLCPVETEQKPTLVMTRILNTLNVVPGESLSQEKTKAPTPECLSQVYQALSTLYSFEADASDQDISDMASDYEALREVSKNLNNFCSPEIVVDTNNPDDNTQDCDTTLQNIGNILSGVSPTDANNVIETIQELWNEYPGFKENCMKKREEVNVDKYRKGVEAIEDAISTASDVRELNDLKKLVKKVGTILTMFRG